jgi:cyclopropane-fatty-acyl-phospholipid synthase
MGTPQGPGSDAARITLKLLDDLFGAGTDVAVRLWNGTRWPDDRPRAATLVLRHPGALRAMFRAGTELALSEAYLHDDFDIEGDMLAVHGLADTLAARAGGWAK